MKSETKKFFSERILSFVNRYLKEGTIVQHGWSFYARGELEGLIREAYLEGLKDKLSPNET